MRTLVIALAAIFAAALFGAAEPAAAQSCACACINADGDLTGAMNDRECCTPADPADPEGTLGNLQADGICGCIAVDGVAATNGWIQQGPAAPSGCIQVGPVSTNDVLMEGDCNTDGLAACRSGGCTTITYNTPACGG